MSAPPPDSPGAPYRSVGPASTLAPPPRHVPGRLRALLYFGSAGARVGWIFVAIGSAMFWFLGTQADWSPLTVHGPYDHYQGEVLRTRVTSTGQGHRHSKQVEVTFRYAVGDTLQQGVSYGNGDGYEPPEGSKVTIEVPRGHFDQAVVEGMRRRALPLWALLAPLVFLVVGLGFASYRVRSGRREVRLLATGLLGHGRLVRRERTNVKVNNRVVEKLSFDFEDARGRVHRAIARTDHPERLVDEVLEPLVYDPAAPSRGALLDALPGLPRLDAAGQLVFDGSPWTLFGALALPAVALFVNLVAAFVALAVT